MRFTNGIRNDQPSLSDSHPPADELLDAALKHAEATLNADELAIWRRWVAEHGTHLVEILLADRATDAANPRLDPRARRVARVNRKRSAQRQAIPVIRDTEVG